MRIAQAIFIFLIGFGVGWYLRWLQFKADKECANPEHEDKSKESK